jgi:hypothetical protein
MKIVQVLNVCRLKYRAGMARVQARLIMWHQRQNPHQNQHQSRRQSRRPILP